MAIIKCKMCGGDLDLSTSQSVVECEYCGTRQTVPTADNEKKMTLFSRANRLRLANEFDKAAGIYESIVAEFPEEAEAYWGLVLCRYGIEYVDDPATGKKIPTCHRSSFDSIMEDGDFEQAVENSDVVARKVYREEAKTIEEIRKGILEVSAKEEPYDIFICYKETAADGNRTLDSVIAQDVYDALTEKGYRVFFSRVTLEDKLGSEYEPYIFAALNSAKVMLAFGTDYEYFNAVWVKNEWSRFLALIAAGEKKTLIPCFKDIDAYDMPKEFTRLQAQDMGKVGAIQDLLRGIEKIIPQKTVVEKETVVVQQIMGPNVDSLIKRGFMLLEDEEWDDADDCFHQVLNINPECAEAYLGLAMSDTECSSQEEYHEYYLHHDCSNDRNLNRSIKYATGALLKSYECWREEKNELIKKAQEKKNAFVEKRRHLAKKAMKLISTADYSVSCVLMKNGLYTLGNSNNDKCKTNWSGMFEQVVATNDYTVGLKVDGTVRITDNPFADDFHKPDVSDWTEITKIAGGAQFVGLKKDGTVVETGYNGINGNKDWVNIVDIAALSPDKDFGDEVFGLRADGTVITTSSEIDVSTWEDIISIVGSSGSGVLRAVYGITSGGTVVATGKGFGDNWNNWGQGNVSTWKNITALAASSCHVVGVREDGTVIATGRNDSGQCDVSSWKNIIAVSVGVSHTIGLKENGTIVIAGKAPEEIRDLAKTRLFYNIETFDEDRKKAQKEEFEEIQKHIASLKRELANLPNGLFTGFRKKELEAELAKAQKKADQTAALYGLD